MHTTYHVRLRYRHNGSEIDRGFDTMTARNMYIIALEPWADLVKEWEEAAETVASR